MSVNTPEPDLERRKQVRVRLRPDLVATAQKYEGTGFHVFKDPLTLRYYRFDEFDAFLLSLMDGTHSLDDIQKAFEERFRPRRMTLEDLEGFAQQLLRAGLAGHDLPQGGQQLYENRQKRRRQQWLRFVTNILYIEIPLFDPDATLAWLAVRLRWLLTPACAIISASFLLTALLLIATHFDAFWRQMPSQQEFFSFKNLFYLWLAVGLVKVLHEFGHGVACKAFGGEVHDMGILFMCLSPCLYLNVSDAWTLPDKWKRIIVGLAGVYVELMLAALGTFVWWNTAGEPVLHNLAMGVMVVSSVNTVLFNGNPLLRFDGYYVLADWLEVPNLKDRCNAFLKYVLLRHCLGIDVPPEPAMGLWRRVGFIIYAVASYVYGWVVTFSVLWFLSRFLVPYKLAAVGGLLALFALGSMIGWPLYRLGRALHGRGWRLPAMHPGRVTVMTLSLTALLAFVCFVPLPISRVRQTALVQLRPEAGEKVFSILSGTLEQLHVRDGQRVAQGDIVAELRNRELEGLAQEARSQHAIRLVQLRALRQQAAEVKEPAERSRLEIAIAQADGERKLFAQQLAGHEKNLERLILRAPRAGVVMGLPRRDEIGKLWEKELGQPFCTIGNPGRLRVIVPVAPADYRLIKEDIGHLSATLRVQGWAGKTWHGRLASLPESEAQEVPFGLTTRAGGPLAVKPGTRPGVLVPQNQQYLVAIDFVDAEHDAIWPGTLGQVKIHCRWRSCAWWLWRTISLTFDLGLI